MIRFTANVLIDSNGESSAAASLDRGAIAASANLPSVAGKQFWLGPARSSVTVTFWVDTDVIHLLIAGARRPANPPHRHAAYPRYQRSMHRARRMTRAALRSATEPARVKGSPRTSLDRRMSGRRARRLR
jgi:hypothetical protein